MADCKLLPEIFLGEVIERGIFSLREKVGSCQRVAVGVPGRAPTLRGRVRASFHSPLQRLVNQHGTARNVSRRDNLCLAGVLSEAKPRK